MNTASGPLWMQALIGALTPGHIKARREAEFADTMRRVCHEMIDDLEPNDRQHLGERIERANRRENLLDLRACLFDAISMRHGERIARERLTTLDLRCH